jgi:hypothetical protein
MVVSMLLLCIMAPSTLPLTPSRWEGEPSGGIFRFLSKYKIIYNTIIYT